MIKIIKGFSLIEMLVVMSVFAVIGVLTTTAVSLTLRSSKKSDSIVRVRENLNYSMAILERQIRNAESISECPLTSPLVLPYISSDGIDTSFTCDLTTPGYIASGSAITRLTSNDISITACSFSCSQTDINNPAVINVSLTAEDATQTGPDKGSASTETEIIVRNY